MKHTHTHTLVKSHNPQAHIPPSGHHGDLSAHNPLLGDAQIQAFRQLTLPLRPRPQPRLGGLRGRARMQSEGVQRGRSVCWRRGEVAVFPSVISPYCLCLCLRRTGGMYIWTYSIRRSIGAWRSSPAWPRKMALVAAASGLVKRIEHELICEALGAAGKRTAMRPPELGRGGPHIVYSVYIYI